MKILNLSEKSTREEFDKTGLPKSMYGRYKKYLSDLDCYYYKQNLNSPRMQQRILTRASNMIISFYNSINDGQSIRLADDTARKFLEGIDPHIAHDYIRFLRKYMLSNGITELKDIVRELVGDEEDIDSLLAGKPGKRPYALTRALIAKDIYTNKDFDSITMDIMGEMLPGNDVISLMDLPYESLKYHINRMKILISNKHLRRHVKRSSNLYFIHKQVLSIVLAAEKELNDFTSITIKNWERVPHVFKDRTDYLYCLVETVKDIYQLY